MEAAEENLGVSEEAPLDQKTSSLCDGKCRYVKVLQYSDVSRRKSGGYKHKKSNVFTRAKIDTL